MDLAFNNKRVVVEKEKEFPSLFTCLRAALLLHERKIMFFR